MRSVERRFSRQVRQAVVVLLTAALAMAPGPADAKLAGDKVRIGVVMPQGGLFIEWGQHGTIGTEIARDEINAAGGIGGVPVELVTGDDRSDPKESVTLTRKLAQTDRVLAIHGSISSSSAGVMFPLAASLKIPIISPTAAAPGLTEKSRPWSYVINPGSARQLGIGLAALKKQHPGVGKAVVLYNSADAISTAEATRVMPVVFQGASVQVLDTVTFQTADLDFSAQVTRALAKHPEMLFLGSGSREAALIAREARKQGFRGPILGGVATATPDLIALGGEAIEGWYTVSYAWNERPVPKVQVLVKKFLERSGGKRPNSATLAMYDQLYVTKMCIETTGVTNKAEDLEADRERIAKCWAGLKGFDGALGAITMNEQGVNVGQVWPLTVKRGVFTLLE
jgi:branched-chain amino acid transport system substrate-binding protein